MPTPLLYLLLLFSASVAIAQEVHPKPQIAHLLEGEPASERFSWFVALSHATSTPGSDFYCGGTLIHPSWVLTAAHCVSDSAPKDITVSVPAASGEGYQSVAVTEVRLHPGYLFRQGFVDADLALLRIDPPITDRQTPLFLENEKLIPEFGETVRALGWRKASANTLVMEELDLPVASLAAANIASMLEQGVTLNTDSFPVGSVGLGKGICFGDSGGPLIYRRPEGWRLIGVAAYVIGDCGDYAVFSSLDRYRDWIYGHIYPDYWAWAGPHDVTTLWNDDDLDGRTNFNEFAMTTNPTKSDSLTSIIGLVENNAPALAFRGQILGVDYQLEHSNDLVLWNPETPEVTQLDRETGPNEIWRQFTSRQVIAEESTRFLRLTTKPSESSPTLTTLHGNGFYMRGDAARLRDPASGEFTVEYLATGLVNGTTVFRIEAALFEPRIEVLKSKTREVLLSHAVPGSHLLECSLATRTSETYLLRLTSAKGNGTGNFTFHYPLLPNPPSILSTGQQTIESSLSPGSDYDGTYYYRGYLLLGAVGGDEVEITMESDSANGGFRPYLAVRDGNSNPVAETSGEPQTVTKVRFTLQGTLDYYVFATTLLPDKKGTYRLSAKKILPE